MIERFRVEIAQRHPIIQVRGRNVFHRPAADVALGAVLHHAGHREIDPILKIICIDICKWFHTQFECITTGSVSKKMRQLAR